MPDVWMRSCCMPVRLSTALLTWPGLRQDAAQALCFARQRLLPLVDLPLLLRQAGPGFVAAAVRKGCGVSTRIVNAIEMGTCHIPHAQRHGRGQMRLQNHAATAIYATGNPGHTERELCCSTTASLSACLVCRA